MHLHIGTMVLFVDDFEDGFKQVPAVITKVHNESCVNLHVFYDRGFPGASPVVTQAFKSSSILDLSEKPRRGTWSFLS